MAPGDRNPVRPAPLLLLLLWIVTSSLFSTGLCGGEEYSVCNTQRCSVEPNCFAALHVTCDYQDEPLVTLRKGDFPASVESINIYGVRQVVIYEHALLDLTSLVKVELRGIDKLTVQPHGLALRKNASLLFFYLGEVEKVTIESSAFSGFWERGARIKMEYISKLHIQQNAFSFQSLSRSPSLIIEAVEFLDMASNAFNAPFTRLTLKAVSTKLCKRNTFSGIVRRIEMEQAQIREVKEGCINGTGDLNLLSMSYCSLGIIHSRGIYGEIRNVKIRHSKVTTVKPNGFQLQVGSLRIKSSGFKSLMTIGLNVLASSSIFLRNTNVRFLRSHALIALKVPKNQVDNRTSMRIYNLTVLHPEKGSLMFDKAVGLKLNRLSVRAPEHPVCPTSRWVRWLTGTDESEPLSLRDQQILADLRRDWLCQENSHTATSPQMTTDDLVTATEPTVTVKPSVQDYYYLLKLTFVSLEVAEFIVVFLVLAVLVFLAMFIICMKKSCETKINERCRTDSSSDLLSSSSRKSKEYTEVSLSDSAAKSRVRKRKKKTVGSNKS